jgi:hypothetical protein
VEFNLADLFENAVDTFPEREYLVAEGQRRSYAQMDARANRLAHHLAAQGVRPGDHVGIYAYNSADWVEALWAVFKLRAVWININYRYVEDELRYLFDNADLVGLVYQREFAPRIAGVRSCRPRHDVIDDGGGTSAALACIERRWSPAATLPRSGSDRYLLYTGGTTGMPKGVVWRHEASSALGADRPMAQGRAPPGTWSSRRRPGPPRSADRPAMHGATQWAVSGASSGPRRPHGEVRPVQVGARRGERSTAMITGDAMAAADRSARGRRADYACRRSSRRARRCSRRR